MVPAVLNLRVCSSFGGCQSSVHGGGGGLFAQGLKARTAAGLVVAAFLIALMDFPFSSACIAISYFG